MKLDKKRLPKHVAIVLDGNRRWSKKKGLPSLAGHRKVVDEVLEDLVEYAGDLGIPYITFWAWSTENWKREKAEVTGVMRLFRFALKNKIQKLIDRGARLRTIGDMSKFPKDIQKELKDAINNSKKNKKVTVILALNYGGREELLQAFRRMIAAQLDNTASRKLLIQPLREPVVSMGDRIDEKIVSILSKLINGRRLEKYLYTAGMPDPDLIIRPGGQKRLSGFLLWQSEYAELYFTDTLMPDFDTKELDKALIDFQQRKRRFGGGGFEDYSAE